MHPRFGNNGGMVNKILGNSLGLVRGGRHLIASQGHVGMLFEVNPQPVASFARNTNSGSNSAYQRRFVLYHEPSGSQDIIKLALPRLDRNGGMVNRIC